jgi:dTDP-glucose 4,6-dehydratase
MTILITGGKGFIGSNFIHFISKKKEQKIINIDKETYAADDYNLKELKSINLINKKFDINDFKKVTSVFKKYKPNYIYNFAAESHVDRSIKSSSSFVKTNIQGTHNLLRISLDYLRSGNNFKFIHISTDEVFGSLNNKMKSTNEKNPYRPNSPYAASKAAADHLVRSFYKTYNLPAIITYSSNNYGPRQNKEKLIPMIINNVIKNKEIPIY